MIERMHKNNVDMHIIILVAYDHGDSHIITNLHIKTIIKRTYFKL